MKLLPRHERMIYADSARVKALLITWSKLRAADVTTKTIMDHLEMLSSMIGVNFAENYTYMAREYIRNHYELKGISNMDRDITMRILISIKLCCYRIEVDE